MSPKVADSGEQGSRSFRIVVDAFLAGEGLPFSQVLCAERIERVFEKHDCSFGSHGVYSTPVTLWAFLSQALADGKQRSCQAAVAQVAAYRIQVGLDAPTADTGNYCRAREKLSEEAVQELTQEVAEEVEQAAPQDWLWKGHHAKLIDGFTFTMPDTPENREAYPHPKTQKRGVGLPIARVVSIISLATACVLDLALGPYKGKQTGESALLRSLLGRLAPGDIAVMDRYYCSFLMIGLLLGQGTQVCARKHQRRHSDFRRGKRLGRHDHLIIWTRPERPDWMDEADYLRIPEQLVLREIRYDVVEPGRRTRTVDVITTLLDPKQYSKADIAELYGFRWNAELDIRSIKASLNLAHVSCKSPTMVRTEVWTTILGYNLIRTTAACAAQLHRKQARQISFTGTCQHVLALWMTLAAGCLSASRLEECLRITLKNISQCTVGDRPGRLEPRVLKRRRHGYKLMQEPRDVLRRQLHKLYT